MGIYLYIHPSRHPGGYICLPVYPSQVPSRCTSLLPGYTVSTPVTLLVPYVHGSVCGMCTFGRRVNGARRASQKGVKEAKTEVSGGFMPLPRAIP